MQLQARLTNPIWVIILVALCAILIVSAVLISRPQDYMVNGDFFESWLAGHALWAGIDLYNPDSWGPAHVLYGNVRDNNVVYPFPPVFALVFAPLGILPLPAAVVIWVFASQWFLILSVIALGHTAGLGVRVEYLLPIIAGVFIFRPTIVTLNNGQNGALFLLVLVATALLWQRYYWFSGGFLLSFILLRPNIGIPIVGIVGLWCLMTRNWKALGGIFSGLSCSLLVSQIMAPGWIDTWTSVGNNKLLNTFGYHPSLWGLVGLLSRHNLSVVIWVGLAMALIVTCGTALWLRFIGSKLSPMIVLAVAIPIGLSVAPYLWAYDQVLLIFSLVVCAGILVKRNFPYLIPATLNIFMSIFALMLFVLAIFIGQDSFGGILSVLVAGLVYVSINSKLEVPGCLNIPSEQSI